MNRNNPSTTRSSRLQLPVVSALAMILLTACSANEPVENDFKAEFFADLELVIEDAKDGNASAEQIAALEIAQESGEISLEVAREGAHAMAACLTDLGWSAGFEETTAASGMVLPSAAVIVPESEAERDPTTAIDECEREHFYWLNQMYSTQPVAMEMASAHIRERAHLVSACLADNGFPVDEDASVDELINAHWDLLLETETRDGGPVDCLYESGIETY